LCLVVTLNRMIFWFSENPALAINQQE